MIVRWTTTAARDLTHICDYTENLFGLGQARRAALRVYVAVDALKEMPLRGRVGRQQGTRELAVPDFPFVIIYRVRGEATEIIRILHGAQQWP